jgi:hypothetical protein
VQQKATEIKWIEYLEGMPKNRKPYLPDAENRKKKENTCNIRYKYWRMSFNPCIRNGPRA